MENDGGGGDSQPFNLSWAFSSPPSPPACVDPFGLLGALSLPPPPPPPPLLLPASSEEVTAGSSRGFRHMMRERERRERLSQGYADLHSVLLSSSRSSIKGNNKISIVQSAGEYLKELQEERDDLLRRNGELQRQAAAVIRVEAEEHSSPALDLAIAALRSLKRMELEASAVRTESAGGRMWAEVAFATEVAREEVEREMKAALAATESQL